MATKQKAVVRKPNNETNIEEVFQDILELITKGYSVVKASNKLGTTSTKFYYYIDKDENNLFQYTRAREDRGDSCIDKIEDISQMLIEDKIDAHKARVLIDTEKWKASKFYPKMFGDKVQQDVTVKGDIDITKHFSKEDLIKAGKEFIDKNKKDG